jgi:hypothetical protein
MSQITYRANLATDDIPLLSSLIGRTVIVGKIDQDYELSVNTQNKLQKEKQIPEAYYVHNVMPTGQGYQSVGFDQKIAPLLSATDFGQTFVLRDPDENKTLFSPAAGKNYIFDRNINLWRSISSIAGADNLQVTIAYINGETYIFYEKIGCFKYNRTTQLLEAVVLTGLTVTLINGICSSNGFLLAWDDDNTVYRSQAASPLNFTPDPSLGSGSGIPEDIRGKIVVLLPITNGFIVYTTANAVAAIFQQNIRYPFIYREVEGSSGILSSSQVSWEDNLGEHYAWTKSGLQKLNKSKAAPVFPELTDFLVAKIFEDYDSVNDDFLVTNLSSQLSVNVTVTGSRFAVISYGISDSLFTHAIIYDMAYKRFGKVKIDHVDVFNFAVPNLSGEVTWAMLDGLSWDDLGKTTWADFLTQVKTAETPKEIIAFIDNDGKVSIVNFSLTQITNDAVIVLGKYQYVRDRLITFDAASIENIPDGSNFTLKHLTSVNGKTTAYKSDPTLVDTDTNYRRYHMNPEFKNGINHSLVGKGSFHLTSLELEFHTGSRK